MLSLAMKTARAGQGCISLSPYVQPGNAYAVPKLLHTVHEAAKLVNII